MLMLFFPAGLTAPAEPGDGGPAGPAGSGGALVG
jgi:hypothetical protein